MVFLNILKVTGESYQLCMWPHYPRGLGNQATPGLITPKVMRTGVTEEIELSVGIHLLNKRNITNLK